MHMIVIPLVKQFSSEVEFRKRLAKIELSFSPNTENSKATCVAWTVAPLTDLPPMRKIRAY